jgi:hypothetical protein
MKFKNQNRVLKAVSLELGDLSITGVIGILSILDIDLHPFLVRSKTKL